MALTLLIRTPSPFQSTRFFAHRLSALVIPLRTPSCAPISSSSPLIGSARQEPSIALFDLQTPYTNLGEYG